MSTDGGTLGGPGHGYGMTTDELDRLRARVAELEGADDRKTIEYVAKRLARTQEDLSKLLFSLGVPIALLLGGLVIGLLGADRAPVTVMISLAVLTLAVIFRALRLVIIVDVEKTVNTIRPPSAPS